MIDNVVPFIRTEEKRWKRKRKSSSANGATLPVRPGGGECHLHPGPRARWHTEAVSVKLGQRATPAEVAEVFRAFKGRPQMLDLPSAPRHPIVVRDEPNRPQPNLDRDTERGMASVVGRVRECPIFGVKYVLLGHNTIRGAAGASILNAELFKVEGLLPV